MTVFWIFYIVLILIVCAFLNSLGGFNWVWLSKWRVNRTIQKIEVNYKEYTIKHEPEIVCQKLLEGDKYTPYYTYIFENSDVIPSETQNEFFGLVCNKLLSRGYTISPCLSENVKPAIDIVIKLVED
jgi:hypothetical protein